MTAVLNVLKQRFYRAFPSAHVGAFIRTIYLKRTLRTLTFSSAFDAGCAEGDFTVFLASRFPHARFTGMDLSPAAIAKAEAVARARQVGNVRFVAGDLRSIRDRDAYDLIYSLDSLEHIPGNGAVLERLVDALRPGGSLFIMMPCEPMHRWVLPRRWFADYEAWAAREHIGDQYTLEELTALLQKMGLRIVEAEYTFGVMGKLAWELHMLVEQRRVVCRLLLPLLFALGYLDTRWPFPKRHPYALRVLARKG